MNSYIYMEDLVANALIQKIERNHVREVRFSELSEYGSRLVSWWSRKKQIHVTVLLSKYDTEQMLFNYSDFFSIRMAGGKDYVIRLRSGKTVGDLRKTFRPYLSVDMLLSFIEAYGVMQ